MRILLTILTLPLLSSLVYGQIETPFYGKSNLGYHYKTFIKDSSTIYFYATDDSSKVVYITDNKYYQVLDNHNNFIVKGEIYRKYRSYFVRKGEWTEYFDNGNIKATGYYYEDQPIGLWKTYYPNGQLKKSYSYALIEYKNISNYCMMGSYQEFYENGQLKINGFYKSIPDVIEVQLIDPITFEGSFVDKIGPVSIKHGLWTYYNKDGTIEKEEAFE